VDGGLEDVEEGDAIGPAQAFQHPHLELGHGRLARRQHAPPLCREGGGQLSTVVRVRRAGDEAVLLQAVNDFVHRLGGHERPPRQLGIRQRNAVPIQNAERGELQRRQLVARGQFAHGCEDQLVKARNCIGNARFAGDAPGWALLIVHDPTIVPQRRAFVPLDSFEANR